MTKRPGFTLFQLLSLLALLGLLFALLVPALAKVRQASERTRSVNNLKQIGLACHSYHDTNGAFPPGDDDNHFSAAARLLPYLEQDQLYKQLDFNKPIADPVNAQARKVVIPTLLSPLDPQPTAGDGYGATNYLFNAGSKYSLTDNDGLFYHNSKIKLADVVDGTSNTLMAGETLRGDGGKKATDVKRQYVRFDKEALGKLETDSGVQEFKDSKHIAGDRCFRWIDGRFLQGTFTGTRVADDVRPDVSAGGAGGMSALRSLDEKINVLMADGSVRTISKKIDLEVWHNLTSRNDGNVLPDF
jgi:prepilin-type processing-associated H-X9-DG protein